MITGATGAHRLRRTLLSVLPLTTAKAGAAAMVVLPVGWLLIGAIAEGSPDQLPFFIVMFPVMAIGALAAFVFGLAAGALAGLPDWLLRHRRPTAFGDVAAVVVLTGLVTGTFALVPLSAGIIAGVLPLPLWGSMLALALATAAATITVVARHRRRERRDAATSLEARPA